MSGAISLRGLTRSFVDPLQEGGNSVAVNDVTLEVDDAELLTVVGPVGCGKSTLLRLIAGLETPTWGDIFIGGRRVNAVGARGRNVGLVCRENALFAEMTVRENIAIGPRISKAGEKESQRRTEDIMDLMGLAGLGDRRPEPLSRSQQLRVALARALAPRPSVLLLDEPFSAVEAGTRQLLGIDIKRWQRELRIPTILVTRHQREAMGLGHRIAAMNHGRIEQVGNGTTIRERPDDDLVAGSIGRVNGLSTASGLHIQGKPAQIELQARDMAALPGNGRVENGGRIPSKVTEHTFLSCTVRLEVQLSDGRPVTPMEEPKSAVQDAGLGVHATAALAVEPHRAFHRNGDV